MLRTILLAAGLVLLVYLVVALGPREILAILSRIGWGFLPIAGMCAGLQALRAWALCLCSPRPGAIAYADAVAVRISGEAVQFLTSTGPFLAEPAKALLLGRRGLTKTEGFAATIAEYLAYNFVAAAMLGGAMAYLLARVDLGPALRGGAAALLIFAVVFLVVAVVAIAGRIYLIGGVMARLATIEAFGRRVKVEAQAVRRMENLLLGVLRERPGRFARVLLVDLAAHAVFVLELWWILRMIGVEAGFGRALVLESASKFAGLVFFFVPGQLGASEGVNAVLFQVLGLTAAAGVAVALARRIRGLLAAGAGLAAMALLTRRSSHQ
jgi:hypothetical protein